MNTELKQKWIKALRSGEYEQGVGKLRTTENNYCCLGVLLDLKDSSGWYVPEDDREDAFFHTIGNENELGGNGCRELGLRSDEETHLIHLNDSERKPFAEIADWIETNIEAE